MPVSVPQAEPAVNVNPTLSTNWNGSNLGNRIAQGYQDPGTGNLFGDGKVSVVTDNHATGATYFYIDSSTYPNASGKMIVEWDMMFQSTGQSGNCWTAFVDSAGKTIFRVMWGIGNATLYEFPTAPDGTAIAHSAGAYPTGSGVAMKAVIDLTANTATISLNGVAMKNTSTQQEVFAIPPTANFSGTRYFTSSTGTRTVAIDDYRSHLGEATFAADFENGTVGSSVPVSVAQQEPAININPTTSTNWNGSTLGNRIAQGYTDPGTGNQFGNGKVAVITDNHATSATYFYIDSTSYPHPFGEIMVEWDMMFQSTGQSGNSWTAFVDSAGKTIFRVMWGIGNATLYEFPTTPDGTSIAHSAGAYPTGTSLVITAVINLDTDTATISINGVPMKNTTTLQEVFAIPPSANFSGTRYFTSGPGTRTIAVDNYAALAMQGTGDLTLVSGGATTYSIYRLPDAQVPQSVIDATADLESVIATSTGVPIPLVKSATPPAGNIICVGDNPTAAAAGFTSSALPLEGFRIVTQGANIFILGPDTADGATTPLGGFSRGTRNGVSTFLENEVGVRWLLPGPDGADIPALSALVVPAQDIIDSPHFLGREFDYVKDSPGINPPIVNDVDKWLVHNKLGKSMSVERAHAWDQFPAQSVLDNNALYMAMLSPGAARQLPSVSPNTRKYCTTNTGLITAFAAALGTQFTDQPARTSASMSPTDGIGGCHCTSPNCRAHILTTPPSTEGWGNWGDFNITRSRQIIKWYDDVATNLASNFPQHNSKLLGGYLYNEYAFPPEGSAMSLHPNVELYWAPRHLYGMPLLVAANVAEYQDVLAALVAKFPGQISYSDYPFWLRNLIGAPLPAPASLLDMIIQAHKDAGTNHLVINSNSAWGWVGLRHYLLARMMWNPDQDINALKDEFMTRAYGPAAGKMEAIYDALESSWTTYMTTRPEVHPDWMTDMTNAMVAGAVVPSYWQIIGLYQDANAMSLTTAQRGRLEMFGDNLKVLTWRLRHMGVPGINATSAAPVYMDDAAFTTWKTANASSLALQENWASTNYADHPWSVNFQNDNPMYNVNHDSVSVGPGQQVAVPVQLTPTVGVNSKAQKATPWTGSNGAQIWYDYKDSVNTTVGIPTTKQLVLKNNAVVEFISGELDGASIGVMEIRWKMLVDSNCVSGPYFLTMRDTQTRNIAALKLDLGAARLDALAYSAPNIASGSYTLVSNLAKGTVVTMKVRMDFTQTIPKVEYYVDNMTTPKLIMNMPKWCDFRQVSFGGTAGVGTVATDDWYIGR